jgi:DNA polymerase elongation subunit (family B)
LRQRIRLKIDRDNKQLNARVLVLKLIANGFYGYLGYYNSRWYCFDCAGATTSLGRKYVQEVISTASSYKFKVLYADTDSAFLQFGEKKQAVNDFIIDINSNFQNRWNWSCRILRACNICKFKRGE